MRPLIRLLPFIAGCALVAQPARAEGDALDRGIALYQQLKLPRALTQLQAALGSGKLPAGRRAKAYLYIGLCRFELGDPQGGRDAFREAIALDPNVALP